MQSPLFSLENSSSFRAQCKSHLLREMLSLVVQSNNWSFSHHSVLSLCITLCLFICLLAHYLLPLRLSETGVLVYPAYLSLSNAQTMHCGFSVKVYWINELWIKTTIWIDCLQNKYLKFSQGGDIYLSKRVLWQAE